LNLFMQNANYSKLTSMHFMHGSLTECITWEQRRQLTRLNSRWTTIKSRTNRSDTKPAPEVAPVAVEAEMSSEEYRAMIELAQVQTIVKCVGHKYLNYWF
jgi:ribonucleoside-diphosphate reductase alpha chain